MSISSHLIVVNIRVFNIGSFSYRTGEGSTFVPFRLMGQFFRKGNLEGSREAGRAGLCHRIL